MLHCAEGGELMAAQKQCLDCGKVLTGHHKASVRCHSCAAKHWRAPFKKPRAHCVDCGKELGIVAIYKKEGAAKKCRHCAQVGRKSTFAGRRHSAETISKMREIARERIYCG